MSSWWRFWETAQPRESITQNALTAAAIAVKAGRATIVPEYSSWQKEAWDFYDQLGEFRFAVDWKSEMISRVRLRAGRIIPGQDEPELLESGIAVELVAELGGGVGGQSEMLDSVATQLGVVGESYLTGETTNGLNEWTVRSADEIRLKQKPTPGRQAVYEVVDELRSMDGQIKWRELDSNSLVVRIWRPHKRMRHLADSPARSMRPTMRELELVNRKIQAQYLSRLASAGVFLMPAEVSFPTREEFQDEEDPFTLEWIETAKEAIERPGTASATVPIPMRVPNEYIEGFRFVDFTIEDDEKIIEKRESAIRRLATQIDVPAEILLGMGDVNHWSAWQLEEQAIKTHISSDVETIVHALTIGYLRPRLQALGEDFEDLVVWYDTSELTIRPDRSDNAVKTYDRGELSGKALRRETGFDETDAPTVEELKGILLRMLAKNPQIGFLALSELTGDPALVDAAPDPADDDEGEPEEPADEDDNERTEPDTRDAPPPTPGVDAVVQATTIHRLEVSLNDWVLHHPECCRDGLFTCPVTQASRYLAYHPGTVGSYECWLAPTGELVLGRRVFDGNAGYVPGHTRKFTRKTLSNGAGTRTPA